jgi:hypothetical protein
MESSKMYPFGPYSGNIPWAIPALASRASLTCCAGRRRDGCAGSWRVAGRGRKWELLRLLFPKNDNLSVPEFGPTNAMIKTVQFGYRDITFLRNRDSGISDPGHVSALSDLQFVGQQIGIFESLLGFVPPDRGNQTSRETFYFVTCSKPTFKISARERRRTAKASSHWQR